MQHVESLYWRTCCVYIACNESAQARLHQVWPCLIQFAYILSCQLSTRKPRSPASPVRNSTSRQIESNLVKANLEKLRTARFEDICSQSHVLFCHLLTVDRSRKLLFVVCRLQNNNLSVWKSN